MIVRFKKEFGKEDRPTREELIELLLKNRGVSDREAFLHPAHPSTITLKSLGYGKEAAKIMPLFEHAMKEKKKLVVYTDYDADGITGGTILWETLHLLGFQVMPYVPHRKHEGYGFSQKGLDRVKAEFDPYLIISVDHGISGRKEIAYAVSLGMKVIVTDHHLAPKDLPDKADAVFHIPSLSGSGVAYFFAKELWERFGRPEKLARLFETDYLALAAIGTIADLVPLLGPSRSVVAHGLKAFPRVKRIGLRHIIKEAGIENRAITPYEIGFVIAPRINAVGRLEHAIDALRLLCTTSEARAHELASRVGKTNKDRQSLVDEAVREARAMVEKQKDRKGMPPLIIILQSPDWNEGIIGLIASKMTEAYDRPTVVLTKSDGAWKGSARSLNDFHLTDFLRLFQPLLLSVGGHKLAAGFSVDEHVKEKLTREMKKKIKAMVSPEDFVRSIDADMKIPLSFATLGLVKDLEQLAPFGIGNPYPTFVSTVAILEKKILGKKNEHVKLLVKDAVSNSFPLEFMAFYKAGEYKETGKGQKLSVVYSLDINRWNGRETVTGKIIYAFASS